MTIQHNENKTDFYQLKKSLSELKSQLANANKTVNDHVRETVAEGDALNLYRYFDILRLTFPIFLSKLVLA